MILAENYGYSVLQIVNVEVRPLDVGVQIFDESDGREVFNELMRLGSDGDTAQIPLPAPRVSNSLLPGSEEPTYYRYTIWVTAEGYETNIYYGQQIFENIVSTQKVDLKPGRASVKNTFYITPHKLRALSEISYDEGESELGDAAIQTAVTFRPVVIPETIVVHLGAPGDRTARNVTVPYIDYLKSVASSEVYPTWPEASLRANVYAQSTLALNRIYTEWYRSQGYDFDITSSPAFDQYYIHERSVFDTIDVIVDSQFREYVRRGGTFEPVFTEYCDGSTVSCDGMSQWGTVSLANQNYTPLDILRYYYGDDVYIATAEVSSELTESFPGYDLSIGADNEYVGIIKDRLNRIAINYPAIPFVRSNNNYFSADLENSVRAFQRIFGLNATGVVDRETWYEIQYIYLAVTKLAELTSEGEWNDSDVFTRNLTRGMRGLAVLRMQWYLNDIALNVSSIPNFTVNGIFGSPMQNAVRAFQRFASLPVTGIIDEATWNAIVKAYNELEETEYKYVYPGVPIRYGMRGKDVRALQELLNYAYELDSNGLYSVNEDGIFGTETQNAVIAFQRKYGLDADGIVGPLTWNKLIEVLGDRLNEEE